MPNLANRLKKKKREKKFVSDRTNARKKKKILK